MKKFQASSLCRRRFFPKTPPEVTGQPVNGRRQPSLASLPGPATSKPLNLEAPFGHVNPDLKEFSELQMIDDQLMKEW